MSSFFVSIAVATCVGPARAQSAAPPAPAPCESVAGFHLLDFWAGSWDVFVGATYAGHDEVKRILNGCAVTEEWTDADKSLGRSLFYYDAGADKWTQVWITDLATARGGLKMKSLVATYPGGGVRFAGALPGPPGSRIILDRTTLTPAGDGRVHQVIEYSLDGGTTWKTSFDALYLPAGTKP